jgi:hypothetical protein
MNTSFSQYDVTIFSGLHTFIRRSTSSINNLCNLSPEGVAKDIVEVFLRWRAIPNRHSGL